jgi:NAD(P)H dehydrogenase (quinone)
MKKMAVIYFSKTGNTEKMAHLIAEGAEENDEVEVQIIKVEDVSVENIGDFDALIIGSPTYYGTMAFQVKKFLDETVKLHGSLAGKVGGAFTSAMNIGGGNETTLLSIIQALLIHGMIIQGTEKGDHYGPVSIGSPDSRVEKQCRDWGRRIADLAKKAA